MDALENLFGSIVSGIQNTRYSELASSTIIVYDHLITFGQEIEHVWNAPWTIGKALFLTNRYYTLFVVTLVQSKTDRLLVSVPPQSCVLSLIVYSCDKLFHWQGWTGLIACALAEITLQLRLYALYRGNKRILTLMIFSFIAVMASSAVIMATTLLQTKTEANLITGMPFCIPIETSNHFYAFWIPILSFETLLCSLALYKGYTSYKDQEFRLMLRRRMLKRRGDTPQQDIKGATLLEILLRDSVAYFIVMFATYLTTIMIWILRPSSDLEIPIGFTVAMSCVMCNRLLLNLRGSKHAQPRRNVSVCEEDNGKSRVQVTSGDNLDGLEGGDAIVEVELGEYELHKLRTLKPTRSYG